ncbi:hypothetical protein [Sphingomicrobium astaxanthinifaciens]|uniref:hypothetical protein n=1 Tax=Sphingomicrobium astaxanthinifaciens TaxID=1227949 RepID=UPI001FCB38B8|nr:hypothetical protein [Sphingomicrobium astaxanthinifaciens]MCJ7422379.1 hypothetical protein [Sphingomicrobium astaxanthinifaciens]
MSDDRNRRAETAKQNDDSEILDRSLETPDFQGRFQGDLETDIGTQAALERVEDPDASEGVDKQDDINHGLRVRGDHQV